MQNKKAIIAIVALFLVICVAFAACKKGKTEPIIVTDVHGNPVTDENGEQITVIPETRIETVTDEKGEAVTDKDGKEATTVIYIPQDVGIPVTNVKGEAVTDEGGKVVTTMVVVPSETTTGLVVTVPVTDDKGETVTDESGSVVTETVKPTLPANTPTNNIIASKALSGSGNDKAIASVAAPDGGFVMAYNSASRDGSFSSTNSENGSAMLCKYNRAGTLEWSDTLSGKAVVGINDLAVASDGSIVVAGETRASDFVPMHSTEYDGFIAKYTADGKRVFLKNWGGTSNESFYGIDTASDGSIYAVGFAYSKDGDCKDLGFPGLSAAVIVKYDSNGNITAQKAFGNMGDYFKNVKVNSAGEIFVSGLDVSGKSEYFENKGRTDGVLFKLKSDLSVIFAKNWGGNGNDIFTDMAIAPDGGVIIAGHNNSTDGDMASVGNKGTLDAMLIKWTANGEVSWVKTFAGSDEERFNSVAVTEQGEIIAAGTSASSTRDFRLVGNLGGSDGFVVRFGSDGSVISAQGFGGSSRDEFNTVCVLTGGQIVAGGATLSTDGYMAGLSPKPTNEKTAAMFFCFRL